MEKKQMLFKTKGMNRDLSVSAFNPEFSFENMNLRLGTNEGNTLMSWVNEKGTASIDIVNTSGGNMTIQGSVIGTAVLNEYLVLFVTGGGNDEIYKLRFIDEEKTKMEAILLFAGSLDFSTEKPLETLVDYEAEHIQKVYWTDGEKQPRVINICKIYGDNFGSVTYNPFDFVPELELKETVTVRKILGANGMFAPGVIQYAFTYYNKYGQESSIFHVTPLLYTSYADRGASPEDKVENAFRITVEKVDKHFEYLRIYSIQRTSINGTPFCKRVQDIDLRNIEGEDVSYTDTGYSGDSIDPTELLYKGGEQIKAGTLEQKDGTLFLGNIRITRPFIPVTSSKDEDYFTEKKIQEDLLRKNDSDKIVGIQTGRRPVYGTVVSSNGYIYANQLTAYDGNYTDESNKDETSTVPCAGFKWGDTYRLGVQFQYKTGQWSSPIHVIDLSQDTAPANNGVLAGAVSVPVFKGNLSSDVVNAMLEHGYKRVRAVVVYPDVQDRAILCQGVVCPTMSTLYHSTTGSTNQYANDLHAQSSWFFRPQLGSTDSETADGGAVQPVGKDGLIPYIDRYIENDSSAGETMFNPANVNMRQVEIQGHFNSENQFKIQRNIVTLHSPDLEFDDSLSVADFTDVGCCQAGSVTFDSTWSDIDIQTETPTISNMGSGFVHRSFNSKKMYGIVSGLFYEDCLVDDDGTINKYVHEESPVKWLVYTWNKSGSLNNDINRPADKGTASAVLKKKVISNLRITSTTFDSKTEPMFTHTCQLFNSNESAVLKLREKIYMGNVDTLLMPDQSDGQYFAIKGGVASYWTDGTNLSPIKTPNIDTPFTESITWKTFSKQDNKPENQGYYKFGHWIDDNSLCWRRVDGSLGETYSDLVLKKDAVRMKYKSTPHLVMMADASTAGGFGFSWGNYTLPIVEITRKVNKDTIFGGKFKDAFRENVWIPCGESKLLKKGKNCDFEYSWGDTYYQRYDCLKTYPFTRDDINQVVEIGSFMLETRVNIDGRYDRNRGQKNNLNMSPQNFNLINPVYSQPNNFFTYRIMDEEDNENTVYPNQITWSKTKNSTADVDAWTNVTLASILEMDGDRGEVRKLARLNDQLICFQDRGISQILYNENVQVNRTDGVPIEIANSGKVQGKRYLSNTVGCSNKWSMATTPAGIYFMDNHEKSIYLLGQNLQNISATGGFNAWSKQSIPSPEKEWYPLNYDSALKEDIGFQNFASFYDKQNQDVLFVSADTALAFSEKLGAFTSFYDYGNKPYLDSIKDVQVWVENHPKEEGTVTIPPYISLWKHQAGDYCSFFGKQKPYWMTLVGNPEPQMDKVFTNLEFRACVDGEGELEDETGKYSFLLPFDSLETWNEYQHGSTALQQKWGHSSMLHHDGDTSALKRKFRMWRCDIPRNNQGSSHKQDRMRNPWLYLKVAKSASTNKKTEIHDMVMTYFV